MTVLLPWFALVVTILAGWAIIKRLSTSMVLLFAGLAMISFAVICGVHGFLPKGVKPSGFVWFDIFELLRSIATKQTSGIGLLIMVAGGYAAYMDRIGAAHALVRVCVKPLDALSSPYLVLVMGYLIGQALVTVIPSAAGLAMLLLVALFPILRAVGCSAAASAAVIGTSAGMTLGPASGTANLAAQTAGLEPIIYFVQCQLPVAIPTLIVVAICHYFVQKYYDKKNDDVYSDAILTKKDDLRNVPGWYAILPVLPIALMIVFSKLVYSAVKLNTISALLLVWVFTIIVELIRRRDFKPVLADGAFIFKAMGGMFSSIVALIICAEFFATGLKVTGLISALITHAQGMGLGLNGMTAVLTGVVGIVTFLTGSGVGAFSSFAALAPEVANGLGCSTTETVGNFRSQRSRWYCSRLRYSDAVCFRHAPRYVSCRRCHHRGCRCSRCLSDGYRPPYLDSDDRRYDHRPHRQRCLLRLTLMNIRAPCGPVGESNEKNPHPRFNSSAVVFFCLCFGNFGCSESDRYQKSFTENRPDRRQLLQLL